ncbi:hypothetical protein [Silvimonas iriomotensis]|uniref:Uncharacterized protein n=1 Tax=Silvimonas iriomotensis TaxID=449662 RepID=A0ABQ2PBC7_9NEIS|nr:hypothetical protein [Silvimonas iriomotensis]GGP22828.1 hypothetical protein GCM10010970_28280 [Silvimonas iriomotensis]
MNDLISGLLDVVIAVAGFLGLHSWVEGQMLTAAAIAIGFCLLVVAAVARADRMEELVPIPVRLRPDNGARRSASHK